MTNNHSMQQGNMYTEINTMMCAMHEKNRENEQEPRLFTTISDERYLAKLKLVEHEKESQQRFHENIVRLKAAEYQREKWRERQQEQHKRKNTLEEMVNYYHEHPRDPRSAVLAQELSELYREATTSKERYSNSMQAKVQFEYMRVMHNVKHFFSDKPHREDWVVWN